MNNTECQAWLDSLKVGDEVAHEYSRYYVPKIGRIESITPTRIFKIDGDSWNRNGIIRGDSRIGPIEPVTQAIHDKIETENCHRVIDQVKWKEVPLPKLRQIRAILEGEES